jgi:hypothetical protein
LVSLVVVLDSAEYKEQKSMKRFFRRKNRSQSTNVGLVERTPKEEQSSKASDLAAPAESMMSSSDRIFDKNGNSSHSTQSVGETKASKGKVSKTSQKPRLPGEGIVSAPSQLGQTSAIFLAKANSGGSNVRKGSEEPVTGNGNERHIKNEARIQYADAESSDIGLLPSDSPEYKGVSPSFRGMDAFDQFYDEKGNSDPDGRFAGISDAYDSISVIEQTKLPRGGVSMETKAIGIIQVCYRYHFCPDTYPVKRF